MALCAAAAACASHSPPHASPSVLAPESPIVAVEAWTFRGAPGTMIRTRSYRLFSTATDAALVDAMPPFLEAALDHYTTALGPLPRPSLKLDTFLMGDRDQWTKLTRQVMGSDASTYLKIERGGFSSGGRAMLWTIGRHDTLAIAAHEGWHQYTQRTFRDELPAWAEEGAAVYMEGFVPDPRRNARPLFLPWANAERLDQLTRAASSQELIPLEQLLSATPQGLIDQTTEGTLTYYAELWALTHFLQEGRNGDYRERLHDMIQAAAEGRLESAVASRLGRPGRDDADVFRAFFGADLDPIQAEFDVFIAHTVSTRVRDQILAGRSPLQPSSIGE